MVGGVVGVDKESPPMPSTTELERRKAKYIPVDPKNPRTCYTCKDCGANILGAQVAHSVWDGPFPCSGSGQVEYETVPYCPNCETKPGFHGSPITPKGSYHNP
jgi:hypothetical protein